MTELYKYQIPSVGAKGVYTLLAPYTTENNEVYECIAVRTISDYLSNGEDPIAAIYTPVKLTEEDYLADAAVDMQIISLRNDKGYTIYVPARYFSKYPVQDGIDFSSYVFQLYLPPIPVGQDTSAIEAELKDLILQRMGVDAVFDKVETSDVRAIERPNAEAVIAERLTKINGTVTAFAQVAQLQEVIETLKTRIAVLEDYIQSR